MKVLGSAAKTSYFYKKDLRGLPDWKIIYHLKCASTENKLSNYLNLINLKRIKPVAIFSNEQTNGVGQYGREWSSPSGGIWLSALYPIYSSDFITQIFPISIAYHLCAMLHKESIKVNIKWPNDIYYGSKKLIGFLPRVITRGEKTLYVRIGIGMNLNNHTPLNGISLSRIFKRKDLCQSYWASNILKVIIEAILFNKQKSNIIEGANKFLNKKLLPKGYEDEWAIDCIDLNGHLRILNKSDFSVLNL